jgi:hypothetical protein
MKSKTFSIVESIIEHLKDLVRAKDTLSLLVKGAVYIALDKKLVTELELHKMFDDAINSYKNKNGSTADLLAVKQKIEQLNCKVYGGIC